MLIDELKKLGAVNHANAKATPLTGGVSCDIFLIEDGDQRLVAKRALEKLKVTAEWRADTSRNIYEQRYLKYLGQHFPQWAPKLLFASEESRFFTMEYLPERYMDWKKRLLNGETHLRTAQTIGEALGSIHSSSWQNTELKRRFDASDNFEELRLVPYFQPLLKQYTHLSSRIHSLCERLRTRKLCLTHGDFSPKNILVSGLDSTDIKIVDCEVAHFGDPEFDVAFLLHHLVLKYWHLDNDRCLELADVFFRHYQSALPHQQTQMLDEIHIVELSVFLILARLDGKSPVEYLSTVEKNEVRRHVLSLLEEKIPSISELISGARQHEYS